MADNGTLVMTVGELKDMLVQAVERELERRGATVSREEIEEICLRQALKALKQQEQT